MLPLALLAGCGEPRHEEAEVVAAFRAEAIELAPAGSEQRLTLLRSEEGVIVVVLANEPEARRFGLDAQALMALAEEEGVRGDSREVAGRRNVIAVYDEALAERVEAALARLD